MKMPTVPKRLAEGSQTALHRMWRRNSADDRVIVEWLIRLYRLTEERERDNSRLRRRLARVVRIAGAW